MILSLLSKIILRIQTIFFFKLLLSDPKRNQNGENVCVVWLPDWIVKPFRDNKKKLCLKNFSSFKRHDKEKSDFEVLA